VVDADCTPDAEPCTVEACEGGGCVARPLAGLDAITCACRRAAPPSCAGAKIPRGVSVRAQRACTLVTRAVTSGKKAARLVRRAAALWSKARTRLARGNATAAACRDDLSGQLADAAARATGLPTTR
jgi:hypothetical protein